MSIEIFKAKIKKHNTHTLWAELKAQLYNAGARPEAWAIVEELQQRFDDGDDGGLTHKDWWIGLGVIVAILAVCVIIGVGIYHLLFV